MDARKLGLHTQVFRSNDLMADAATARAGGFAGLEPRLDKLLRHIETDPDLDRLRPALNGLAVPMAGVLLGIEGATPDAAGDRRDTVRRAAPLLRALGCPALQVVALDRFGPSGNTPRGRIDRLTDVLAQLSEVAAPHGVRLALEPVSFSPFHDLDEAVEVVRRVGTDRAGLVLDTWHLWTAGTSWEAVAGLDPDLIVCAHVGDGGPMTGPRWSDADRAVLPGEGIVPVAEGLAAIARTGYDGWWIVEVHGERFARADATALARDLARLGGTLLDAART